MKERLKYVIWLPRLSILLCLFIIFLSSKASKNCLVILLVIPQIKTFVVFVCNFRIHIVPGVSKIISK